MSPHPPDGSTLDAWLDAFDLNWAPGRIAGHATTVPPGVDRREALVELVKIDLERGWQAGQRPRLEEYLARFPELGPPDDLPDDLIRAEVAARRRAGDEVSPDEIRQRFPQQAGRLTAGAAGTDDQNQTRPSAARPAGDPAIPAGLDRYRIVRRLGAGAMGEVFLARDTTLGRDVALKMPRFDGGRERALRARFRREAAAAARLRHPNLAQAYDVGLADGVDYLTMSYIEGVPLADRIRAGPVAPGDAVRWVVKLAGGLAEAHRQGVVHRDLKPVNIILTPDGEPVVVDFGLALFEEPGGPRLTRDGSVFGTPCYMSPEQVRGDVGTVGPAADVYALGVVLFELLTGTVPFTGGMTAIFEQARNAPPPAPSARRPGLPPALDAVSRRAMAKKPEDRFGSMPDFAAAVGAMLTTPPGSLPAPPPSPPTDPAHRATADVSWAVATALPAAADSPPGRVSRRRWLWAAAGGVAAVGAGGTAAYLKWGTSPPGSAAVSPPEPRPTPAPGTWAAAGHFTVPGEVTCLAGDPHGPGRVAWGTSPHGYGLTDATGKHVITTAGEPRGSKGPVRYVGISPRDRLLVAEYDDGFRFWDTSTGQQAPNMNSADGADSMAHIQAVVWGATGDAIYWVSRLDKTADGRPRVTVGLRPITPGVATKRRNHLREVDQEVRALAVSRDGEKLIHGSIEGWVNGYQVQAPNNAVPLAGPFGFKVAGPVGRLAFLDGRKIVVLIAGTAAGDRPGSGRVEVWDAQDFAGATRTRGVTTTADPDALAVSADDRWAAWAKGTTVCVFDLRRNVVEKLPGHTGKVTAVAFDPNGKTLFSGGADRTVRRWELR